jgi:hypothetical protein
MKEFFHGWRRKAGVATLVMACAFSAKWAESLDDINHHFFDLPQHWPDIVSNSGQLKFRLFEDFELDNTDWEYFDDGADDRLWHPLITVEPFTIGSGRTMGGGHAIVFEYWSLVLPLTLLSAYLILWKPRKRA